MYKNITKPEIRFSVGTWRKGLTYYLSHDKLMNLRPRFNGSGNSNDDGPALAKTDDPPAYNYRLERSYLVWIQKKYDCVFDPYYMPWIATPLPFVDRIHDWTLRRDMFSEMSHYVKECETWKDFFEISRSSITLFPQLLAMSAASLVYGGLHLLAWNAPFRTPIYGLLWKTSGITVASLGAILLLVIPLYLMYRYTGVEFIGYRKLLALVATVLLYLALFCLTLLYVFARIYLVVESFLSLAYLPESVCTTPNFSLYFPHIG
jgi:hypothetical protein